MDCEEIVRQLKSMSDPDAVKGMARYGICPGHAFGVSVPNLRKIARQAGKDHELAARLWDSGIHEARILASMVDNPKAVTREQMESWVSDFNSWDVCDQCCNNLFRRTEYAHGTAVEWSARGEEFVKRAGFVLMACLAVHDKTSGNEAFRVFFPLILKEAVDPRNFVKKAVNWSLRQIGKRNLQLNEEAVRLAEEISRIDSPSARWIASDALRELRSDAVRARLKK